MKSIALNMHDQNSYDGDIHIQYERYTRIKKGWYKGSHKEFYNNHFLPLLNGNDQFIFNYSGGGLRQPKHWFSTSTTDNIFKPFKNNTGIIQTYNASYNNLWDNLQVDNFYYIDHHQGHAAYTFIHSGFEESDILAIDGGGTDHYSVFFDKHGKMNSITDLRLGSLWNSAATACGLYGLSGCGKLMGLAGYGNFDETIYNILWIMMDQGDLKYYHDGHPILNQYPDKNIAHTLQQFTLDIFKEYIVPLKTSDNLCLAGGVIYNGYLNEFITNHLPWKNVHIPPAVGDEGQALGSYMHAEYVLNGNKHVPETYCGMRYNLPDQEIDYHRIAHAIANGKIIGWFQGRSESGNRALGNRSILADPRNPNIKDTINYTIKNREDWRPFAPSVLEDYYQDYFDTDTPSPYMSRIVNVKSEEIPGVTHVDNTSRIQTVNVKDNEKYYKLIEAFYDITGIPMLLNTSFNCQEPIVETVEDALKTFYSTRLDMCVIGSDIYEK